MTAVGGAGKIRFVIKDDDISSNRTHSKRRRSQETQEPVDVEPLDFSTSKEIKSNEFSQDQGNDLEDPW